VSIIKRFDHVSIGVKDVERAKALFIDVLGGTPMSDEGASEAEGFEWTTFKLGGKKMELVSSSDKESGVGRYIEKYGEGYHHISIAVDDLKEAIAYFESKGLRVLAPNFEQEKWKHCYLHPKDTFGALIQVFEENDETLSHADR
jgi:methylmalonyl-CoA/ethylmalonyl-CoA epimerase